MVYTDHIRIDPAYRDALQSCGLTRVEDLLKRVDGRVYAWSRTTDTVYVPCPGGRPGFYLKRYHYPRWRGRLRGTFRGVSGKHLHRYLQEFTYRFNRRWLAKKLFSYLTRRALEARPLPYHRLVAEPIG